jgi:sporulation-control protein spo0M
MLKNLKASYGIHIAVVDTTVFAEVTQRNDVVESLWMRGCSLGKIISRFTHGYEATYVASYSGVVVANSRMLHPSQPVAVDHPDPNTL